VAAELIRRGYSVSLTLGNAPVTAILAVSPNGKEFRVECKGLSARNFWLICGYPVDPSPFYILVYLPKGENPHFYVLTSEEVQRHRKEYAERTAPKGRYRDDLGGLNWSTPLKYKDRWDKLPK